MSNKVPSTGDNFSKVKIPFVAPPPDDLILYQPPSRVSACALAILLISRYASKFKPDPSIVNSPVVFCEIIFLAVSIFADKLVEFVMVACFAFNAVCNPFVLAIVKLPSVMVACLVKIFAVFVAILVVWVAVSVCKELVFCC